MDPIENLKPQPTGGLKLMTVFIAVLALHVVVIGGFTVWHLLYPANVDGDMAVDKHKTGKIVSDSAIADMQAPDSTAADKAAPATDSSTDAPATADASSTASTASTTTSAAPATPAASTTTPAAPATASTAATTPAEPATTDTTTTITVPATPTMVEDTTPAATNPQTASVQRGPVINPPDNLAPPADASTPAVTTPAAPSVATDASPTPTVEGTPYTVKHGDSLAKIARRHHIALAKLRTANGLASDSLHIGQKLVIPNRASAAASTTAVADTTTPAETESETAATTPSPKAAPVSEAPMAQPVESIDNVSTPSIASTATPKHTHHTATHHLYTVVKGDTLTKIARRYHTTTSAIMAANSITNAGRLSIGEKLHIPSHESRAAATASQEAAPAQPETHSSAKGQLANYVQ